MIDNIFLSSSYGAFFRIDNMLALIINKFKNTEITPNIFSYHKRMKSIAEEIWKIHTTGLTLVDSRWVELRGCRFSSLCIYFYIFYNEDMIAYW